MELTDTQKETVEQMIGVWFQTSSSYRMVNRLPEGKTGTEALRESGGPRCDDEKWLQLLGEAACGDHFLRTSAWPARVLTAEEWAYYKKLGGGTYSGVSSTKEKL